MIILFVLFVGNFATTTFGVNVTYDHRAIVIDGKRRVLVSGSIHYPRSTPDVHSFLFVFPALILLCLRIYRMCVCLFMVNV